VEGLPAFRRFVAAVQANPLRASSAARPLKPSVSPSSKPVPSSDLPWTSLNPSQINKCLRRAENAFRAFASDHESRLGSLVNRQLHAVFFEAQCGLVVYRDELWRPALVTHDEERRAVRYDGPISHREAIEQCALERKRRTWTWELL